MWQSNLHSLCPLSLLLAFHPSLSFCLQLAGVRLPTYHLISSAQLDCIDTWVAGRPPTTVSLGCPLINSCLLAAPYINLSPYIIPCYLALSCHLCHCIKCYLAIILSPVSLYQLLNHTGTECLSNALSSVYEWP